MLIARLIVKPVLQMFRRDFGDIEELTGLVFVTISPWGAMPGLVICYGLVARYLELWPFN